MKILITLLFLPTLRAQGLDGRSICSLPPSAGPCLASFTKVYYDPRTRQCEGFTYGGCGGNENNFDSVQECLQRCGATGGGVTGGGISGGGTDCGPTCYMLCPSGFPVDDRGCPVCTCQHPTPDVGRSICDFPPSRGPCNDLSTKYYYDRRTDRCGTFTYSGCGGNANKFNTLAQCNQRCGSASGGAGGSSSARCFPINTPLYPSPLSVARCPTGTRLTYMSGSSFCCKSAVYSDYPACDYGEPAQQCSYYSPCGFGKICTRHVLGRWSVCCNAPRTMPLPPWLQFASK